MLHNRLFIFLFALIALIAIAHQIALSYSLYWTLWWFDIVVHFFAGLWVALFVLWCIYQSGYVTRATPSPIALFAIAISAVLVVGIGWETMEASVGMGGLGAYAVDTISDLAADLAGACTAALVFMRLPYHTAG